MARPTVEHDGFLIPNAADVSNPRMAEPDRIDFNTLAHTLWGVVEGCSVSAVGTQARVEMGTLLVQGRLVSLNSFSTVDLGTGGTQDRFDLVVVTDGGVVTKITGTYAVDPVFPDPPTSVTVLAAVFIPAGGNSLVNNVIDKRKFVPKSLLTKIGTSDDLIRNLNGTGNHFLLDGGGRATWENDTWMWRSAPETLTIHKHLKLEGLLTADGGVSTSGDVSALGNVYGKNLVWNGTAPVTALPGAIWQDSATGKIWVWKNGGWQEMATVQSAMPVGTVLTSFEIPSVMNPMGWISLQGQVISEEQHSAIFNVQGMQHMIYSDATQWRKMKLPDARRRVLLSDFGSLAGIVGGPNLGNKVTLKIANMPRHEHNPRTQDGGGASPQASTSREGSHVHEVTRGEHDHEVVDPGHAHNGMNLGGIGVAAPVIALMWGGNNKIDALFNDRNHTYSVEAMEWTMPAVTGIRVGTGQSAHGHEVKPEGIHYHNVNIDPIPAHKHDVDEDLVGNDTPFDITPEYITVFTYVRS